MFGINFDFKESKIYNYNTELKSLYVYEYFKKNDENIIVVTTSLFEANIFYQSISNYTNDVLLFPMDDFLTSEALAISPELKTTRLETLDVLKSSKKRIVVCNLMGYLRYVPTKQIFDSSNIELKVGDNYKISDLIEKLYNIGYEKEILVDRTGTIAVRGFVIDIFPINEKNPIRIEFWGDSIDSIRIFDINNQLKIEDVSEVKINPNTEFISNRDHFNVDYRHIIDYIDVTNISNYTNSMVFFDNYNNIKKSYDLLLDEITNYNISLSISADTKYMFDFSEIKNLDEKYFYELDDNTDEKNQIYDIEPFFNNFQAINKRLNDYIEKGTVILCLSNRYVVNKVIDNLANNNIVFTSEDNLYEKKVNIIVKQIEGSFRYQNIYVISENIFFNKKDNKKIYKTNFKIGTKIRDITKLDIGDYVVHSINGIGQYEGLKTINKDGMSKDYLTIRYRDSDKLYIPVEKIEYITKYSSSNGVQPKLNKLGSSEWYKTKIRVKAKVKDIARELLSLYALREKSSGFAFLKDNEMQNDFESLFPYNETVDQLKVIDEVKKDMQKSTPMDRLICGDVGYGKTEIAFRAMFKAILSGKQVALLCPTTILSQQHYVNALSRFDKFPVNICILNRFVKPTNIRENLLKIKEGKIDIVIGTHRLLSEDVKFADLGLLVIDEEQRFGVKHKEKIKELKNNIDVLTLSATPIPRTLQMSMAGLRNLSLIETPPSNRYPIQTYVLSYNNQIIRDAIYKELSRDGQIFILYNNIENMDTKYYEIKSLVPEAKIICAHGKMEKNQLEDIMYNFTKKEFDILLCTTIIETGIDIPNVNTLIIIDADKFGLSQLYQIRGRVGRSNKIAYCYLFYDKAKILNEIAVKRLKAIKEFTELGSGFSIAMRDLAIRGAGNILGSEQSGFVDTVGVEMFMKLLNEEIDSIKGIEVKEVPCEKQPFINIETSIPNYYINDEEIKIEIHKKINSIDSLNKIEEMSKELRDRFGPIPDNLTIYMYEELFEKRAYLLGIKEIYQTKNSVEIILPEVLTKELDGEKLFLSLYQKSKMYRMGNKYKRVMIILDTVDLSKHFIYYLLDLLEIIQECTKKKAI